MSASAALTQVLLNRMIERPRRVLIDRELLDAVNAVAAARDAHTSPSVATSPGSAPAGVDLTA